MAKRFTDTDKWSDSWFSSLSINGKLLFMFLCDNCNLAGIIEVNTRIWSAYTSIPIKEIEEALIEIEKCYVQSDDKECIFIKNFLKHQKNYPINLNNKAHVKIISLYDNYKHKFDNKDINDLFNIKNIRGVDGGSKGDRSPAGIGIGIGIGNKGGVGENKTEYLDQVIGVELPECKKILSGDLLWKEVFCMNNKISIDSLNRWLNEYFKKLQNEGVTRKSEKDAKQHFSNWFRLEHKKNNETEVPRKKYQKLS